MKKGVGLPTSFLFEGFMDFLPKFIRNKQHYKCYHTKIQEKQYNFPQLGCSYGQMLVRRVCCKQTVRIVIISVYSKANHGYHTTYDGHQRPKENVTQSIIKFLHILPLSASTEAPFFRSNDRLNLIDTNIIPFFKNYVKLKKHPT